MYHSNGTGVNIGIIFFVSLKYLTHLDVLSLKIYVLYVLFRVQK